MKSHEERINSLYSRFFKDNRINPKTGRFLRVPIMWKFATFPFIGSQWGSGGSKKILFVGLDVGRDEDFQRIISIADKRNLVEKLRRLNPHLQGIVLTIQWLVIGENRQTIKKARTYGAAVKLSDGAYNFFKSHACLTNLYKFVTEERKNRMGGENRTLILRNKAEEKLLLKEIRILKPDIIVLQGKEFLDKKFEYLLNGLKKLMPRSKIYHSFHPSFRGRSPKKYLESLKSFTHAQI